MRVASKVRIGTIALVVGLVGGFSAPASAAPPPGPVSCTGHGPFTAGTLDISCVVGADLTGIHVVAVGAPGGPFSTGASAVPTGGKGAVVTADMAMPAGTTIFVSVGGAGSSNTGGANGGGAGRAGGGGASDLRIPSDAIGDRVLVAGGGGGGGFTQGNNPAAFDGASADGGSGGFIVGGTSAAGGTAGQGGGEPPCGGGSGFGPSGFHNGLGGQGFGLGGGGGGGFAGGGAGGEINSGGNCDDNNAGGGGGGSSLVPSDGTNVTDTTGTPMITITAPVPATSSGPTIAGTAVVGQTLTETHAPWSNTPSAIAVQWLRCDASGNACAPTGTGAASYLLTADDVGHTIKVQETATNFYGSSLAAGAAGTAVSTPTGVVGTSTSPPTITATSPACQQIEASVKNNNSSGPAVQYTVTATSDTTSLSEKTTGTALPGQSSDARFSALPRGGTYTLTAQGDDGSVTTAPATVKVAKCVVVKFKVKIGRGRYAHSYAPVKLNNRGSNVSVNATVVSVHHSSHDYTLKAHEVRTVNAFISPHGHSKIKVIDNVGVEPKRKFFRE